MPEPFEVIAGAGELAPYGRIWGTGGWLMPQEREALDWATFARLLGWGVHLSVETASADSQWVVLALPPGNTPRNLIEQLEGRLKSERILVIARAAQAGTALAALAGVCTAAGTLEGSLLEWTGPGPKRQWTCARQFTAPALSLWAGASVWAAVDNHPIIVGRNFGCGAIATLGFHPSEARDQNGAFTALLRHLLICGPGRPVAWLDWEGVLALRMDDPGGAQNVHSRNWHYPKLTSGEWRDIGEILRQRKARLSIGYVAGWVDDGAEDRGKLAVHGIKAARKPGAIHPSPLVRYEESSGLVHDYESEYAGIQRLRAEGLAEVEYHGYTHMRPDLSAWVQAADGYDSVFWFRELSGEIPEPHPLEMAKAAFRRWFDRQPAVLICPGDEWDESILERALDLGIEIVSSYYLGLRDGDRMLWSTHVCAPYLNQPDGAWFDSGLPVVGYFHDREPALEGIDWFRLYLDQWCAAGARRIVGLDELAAALSGRLVCRSGRLRVENSASLPLPRGLKLGLYLPSGCDVLELPADSDPKWTGDGFGKVSLAEVTHCVA